MDKYVIDKAEKDVQAIKAIIDRTTEDFMQLGKIFIGWGLVFLVLFIGVAAAYVFKARLSDIIERYPIITVVPLILAAGAASVSYIVITRMKGLHGLTKPLLAVWLVIVSYVTVFPVLRYISSIGRIVKDYKGYYINNYNIFIKSTVDGFFHSYTDIGALLFAFTFGLLCLRVFTRLKFAGVLAFIYFILITAECAIYITTATDGRFYTTFSIISYSVIVPATFLIIGGYLESRKLRRS